MSLLLFFFAVALLGLGAIGSRFLQYSFKTTRVLPRFGTVGEPLQYEVMIQNLSSTVQRGLKFREIFPDVFPRFRDFMRIQKSYPVGNQWIQPWRQYVAGQRRAIAYPQDIPILSAETKTKVIAEVLPLRRGRLNLETIALACPDPLGLIYKNQSYALSQSICILPKRYQLPPLNLSNARRYQQSEHSLVSSIGEALEFRALRDYRPGDPTNKIHWKSWAKVGRPIVKEQQDESAIHHALVLDTFQMDTYNETFEAAITVAISYLTQEQPEESLLDVIFTSQEAPCCVTVGRGMRQRSQILEAIATLSPCQHQDLDTLMPILQTRLPRLSGCFCIFIDLDARRYAFLKMLAQWGVPIKAIFLCDHNLLQAESFDDLLTPQCRTHFVSINNMQQDLLLL
jgi:hypothetical protein